MKADKGNCFVVMDRPDYDNKMETLLNDRSTYEVVSTSPFRRIERELNAMLLSLTLENLNHLQTSKKLVKSLLNVHIFFVNYNLCKFAHLQRFCNSIKSL